MADKKTMTQELKKAFSLDNDILQYMMKNTPADALKQAYNAVTSSTGQNRSVPRVVTQARKAVSQANIPAAQARRKATDKMNAASKRKPTTAKRVKTPDEMAAAAKKKRDITARVTAAEKVAAAKTAPKYNGVKQSTAGKSWKDYSSIAAANAAGSLYYNKGGKKMAAVTKSDLDKSGLSLRDYMNYKTGKTRKVAPKKAATKKTGMSTGNTVAGVKSTKKPTTNSKAKARDLTLRDKGGISARRNTKGPLAKARKEYSVTGPGSQSKILRNKKAK